MNGPKSCEGHLPSEAPDGLTQEASWSGQCRVLEPEYSTLSLTSTEMALRMNERNRLRWM